MHAGFLHSGSLMLDIKGLFIRIGVIFNVRCVFVGTPSSKSASKTEEATWELSEVGEEEGHVPRQICSAEDTTALFMSANSEAISQRNGLCVYRGPSRAVSQISPI